VYSLQRTAAWFIVSLYNRIGSIPVAVTHQSIDETLRLASESKDASVAARYYAQAGLAMGEVGEMSRALAAFQKAVYLDPNISAYHCNLAWVQRKLGQAEESIKACEAALELDPSNAHAQQILGNSLRQTGKIDQAIEQYENVVKLRPTWAKALNNLASALREVGERQRAESLLRQAIKLEPENASAHFNLGMILLERGEFAAGWPEFEWRRRVSSFNLGLPLPLPAWDGGPLDGKRIFLHSEQGAGDAIQFSRYIPLVARKGGKIVLGCQGELVSLFSQLDGVDECWSGQGPPPMADAQCSLMSLPGIFGTTLGTIPAEIPYLAADKFRAKTWKCRLPADRFKVGLVWAGQARHANDQYRSMALERFRDLSATSGVWWTSLQKGEQALQIESVSEMRLTDWTNELHNFADTAALMDGLDLVITVDTAVAHLAGAMGKPVWLLLPHIADWRWMMDRTDSPWYPTMRLFRQPKAGDWESVVEQVGLSLRSLA
jgi:Flp pilus assembly protein TadD